jgi:tRNA modification GTPase
MASRAGAVAQSEGGAGQRATVCALSSPPGRGARAVVRVSGPEAARVVGACCVLDGAPFAPEARGAFGVRFLDGEGEQPALLLWMPGPASFTREDVAELHLPGNPLLVEVALRRLHELGARPARPGEFTRRAFENGALDLTRAEGILSLVHASNEAEQRAATALLMGGLDTRIGGLRALLEELRALLEASLDFDETDTGHVPVEELLGLGERASRALAEATSWEVARHGPEAGAPRVVLAGRPNAGKSSLFNALLEHAGGDRAAVPALVDARAGSTRDARAALVRMGQPPRDLVLVDTAGLEEAQAGGWEGRDLDRRAQDRARLEAKAADLVLWVVPAHAAAMGLERPPGAGLLAWSQVDRPGAAAAPPEELAGGLSWVATSARTGAGVGELVVALGQALGGAAASEGHLVSTRHRDALARARLALDEALADLRGGAPLDLVAEGLRGATGELDGITGHTTPEDLLDRIFARFCLGK